jgi:hypothetical protein
VDEAARQERREGGGGAEGCGDGGGVELYCVRVCGVGGVGECVAKGFWRDGAVGCKLSFFRCLLKAVFGLMVWGEFRLHFVLWICG